MNNEYGSQSKIINGVKIDYTLLPNSRDVTHLVVQLNGYRFGGWDFSNAIKSLNSTLLVIEDRLDDVQVCYLGKDGTFEFASAVGLLIDSVLDDLGLRKQDCTLVGASKGGFSALYIGLINGYKNIIASSFVGFIGKWMDSYNSEIATKVMGVGYLPEDIARYDSLLVDAATQASGETNVYVAISNKDNFFLEFGQLQVLEKFNEVGLNCQIFYSESDLIYGHNGVAIYFLPEVLALVNLLSRGAELTFATERFGASNHARLTFPSMRGQRVLSDRRRASVRIKGTPRYSLSVAEIDEGRLFVEGLAYLEGKDLPSYHVLDRLLKLTRTSDGSNHIFPLGAVPTDDLSRKLYSDYFVNYRAAEFATMGKKGIDLSLLEDGIYSMEIGIKEDATRSIFGVPQIAGQLESKNHIFNNVIYRVYGEGGNVLLSKKSLSQIVKNNYQSEYFEITKRWVEGSLFHVEGAFVSRGLKLRHYTVGNFFLHLRNSETESTIVFPMGCVIKRGLGAHIGDFSSNYDSAYFATLGLEGIDMAECEPGEYSGNIIQIVDSESVHRSIGFKINWNGQNVSFSD